MDLIIYRQVGIFFRGGVAYFREDQDPKDLKIVVAGN